MKEILTNLFTTNNINLSLEEIKKKSPNISLFELQQALKVLELDGKVYYNENTNRYYPFPSSFFSTKITAIDETQKTMDIKINNQSITLTYDPSLKINQPVLVGINHKGNYYIIKKLPTPTQCNTAVKEQILDLFYPLANGITIHELQKLVINNQVTPKTSIPLTSKEKKKRNKAKKQNSKTKPAPSSSVIFPNEELKSLLDTLEKEGIIYYDIDTNKYYPITAECLITTAESSKKGLIYIKVDNQPIFLPPGSSKDILPFDKILLKKDQGKWQLIKILERTNPHIVCEVTPKGIKAVGNNDLKVKMAKTTLKDLGLPVGTRILVNIPNTKIGSIYEVEYLETLGHKDDFNAEFDAIAYNNGFVTHYTPQELEQVQSIPTEVNEKDLENRVDLTQENIFTIDGIHTKDFDDAVSIKELANGNYELSVSIAHVHHYIPYGSPLWQRAEKNTTSLYMIDSVSHMLHPQVSNGICSLNPGVNRLAKTFIMEIDNQGKIINFNIIDSVIKSKMRMTYEDVNKILDENIIPEEYLPFLPDILKMQELSEILTNRHKQDGALTFASKEIRFTLDEEENITNVSAILQGPAEKLIENFMVATNEAMAEYMLNLGITFIYRNHEIPLNDKIMETTKLIKSLGYKIEKLKNADDPHVIQKIIQTLSSKEEFFVLSALLLKSMKKAYFSTENKGHYALALKAYSQTTSPIRRFLDLVIQLILDNLEEICKPDFDMESFKSYLTTMCTRASTMERLAAKAEYEADKLYMVNYCAARPNEEYVGFISEITPEYIIVKTKNLIEGIIYLDDINNGNYTYNPETKWIENPKTKEKLFIGSKINMTLKDYNKEFRLLYFQGTTLNHEMMLTRKKD